jgi:hypothetical protein
MQEHIFIFSVAHSLSWYRFIGRILGKALYEGILTEAAFASFFLAKVIFLNAFLAIYAILTLSFEVVGTAEFSWRFSIVRSWAVPGFDFSETLRRQFRRLGA